MPGHRHTTLQHGEASLILDADGHASGGRVSGGRDSGAAGNRPGLYHRTDSVLATYAWRWLLPASCAREARRDVSHDARAWTLASEWHDAHGAPQLALRRILTVEPDGATDVVTLGNLGRSRLALGVELAIEPVDTVGEPRVDATSLVLAASGSGRPRTDVRFDALAAARPDGADWEISLAPGEQVGLHCRVRLVRG